MRTVGVAAASRPVLIITFAMTVRAYSLYTYLSFRQEIGRPDKGRERRTETGGQSCPFSTSPLVIRGRADDGFRSYHRRARVTPCTPFLHMHDKCRSSCKFFSFLSSLLYPPLIAPLLRHLCVARCIDATCLCHSSPKFPSSDTRSIFHRTSTAFVPPCVLAWPAVCAPARTFTAKQLFTLFRRIQLFPLHLTQ